MKNNIVLPLFIIIALTGCAGNLNKSAITEETDINPSKLISSPLRDCFGSMQDAQSPPGVSAEGSYKMIKDYYDAAPNKQSMHNKIMRNISLANSWQQAHGMSQQYLESTKNELIAFNIRQAVATGMLRTFLMDEDVTPEVIKAIEFYMDILQQEKYYGEPNLIATILYKMKPYWPANRIRPIATQSANRSSWIRGGKQITAKQYFQEQASRKDNNMTLESAKHKSLEQEIQQQYITDIPITLKKTRHFFDADNGIDRWFDTKTDAVVILWLLADGAVETK
jgi:hypothetical protein